MSKSKLVCVSNSPAKLESLDETSSTKPSMKEVLSLGFSKLSQVALNLRYFKQLKLTGIASSHAQGADNKCRNKASKLSSKQSQRNTNKR